MAFSSNTHYQKICVSGMRVGDLTGWLDKQSPQPHVRQVTLHVGVNSAKEDTVSVWSWSALLNITRKVFPKATVHASSIIPAYANHPTNKAISASNQHLKTACQRTRALFIDNTSSFITQNGAPKQACYIRGDPFHPSKDGVIKLALNLKYAGSDITPRPRGQHDTFHASHSAKSGSGHSTEVGTAVRLYQFLLEELERDQPPEGGRILEWVDRPKGVFKVVRKDEVARQWGRAKNNTSMTYEKFSRSLRYYYKVKQLERVPGQHLVYRFTKNAHPDVPQQTVRPF
nr:hypothetical protein BaRGS_033540 [Batillaria attramentaria]